MKRILVISAIVVALLAGGWGIWMVTRPSLAAADVARDVVTIKEGTVISTVKATNRLAAELEVSLGFGISGTVAEVLVERGQQVQAGDPIARLETADLELQLAQAEANLRQVQAGARQEDIASAEAALKSAQANYAKSATGTGQEDIALAESALRSAQANYNAQLKGPSEDELTVAAANLRSAEVDLQDAQWAYDAIAYSGNAGETPQAAQLQRATINYQTALANYKIATQGASDEQIQTAWEQVQQAQIQLDKLKTGPSAEDLAIVQAQVDQARASLEKLRHSPTAEELAQAQLQVDQARLNLEKATLTTPIAGTITQVNVAVGERPAASVVLLTDLSTLHIDLQVDEIDLPTVSVDQPAIITLDALPNIPLEGRVTAIAPAPVSSGSGVTGYEVTILLEDQNEQAKIGMTANVEIETARRENVVVVRADLIQVDKTSGATYVEKADPAGQPLRTEVTLGVRSGQNIEVLSGLQAGDRVLVPVAEVVTRSVSSGDGGNGRPFAGFDND